MRISQGKLGAPMYGGGYVADNDGSLFDDLFDIYF
jgi:hypothetical protein